MRSERAAIATGDSRALATVDRGAGRVSIHDLDAVDQLARRLKVDPQQVRKLRNSFYKKHRDTATLSSPSGREAAWYDGHVEFHALTLERRDDSQRDGATKLLFRTRDDRLIESVILRMASGRTSLCVSTQVGCAARCEFCATGRMGLSRNLSATEMLDQLAAANRLLASERHTVRNLVFMGMGEPFHNETELYRAIRVLSDPRAFNLHHRRLLVSTVGIPAAMIRLATRYPNVRLALSLHSARDEVRRRLMPLAEHHGLAELADAIRRVAEIQGHLVMIEYLLLADVNDTRKDAEALIEYLRGLAVHVNLIPYNPIEGGEPFRASSPARSVAFSEILKAAGLPVTTRYSLGTDIAAACGQLVRQQGGVRARRTNHLAC
jgi:23S rRNA (adenine2503-C2)-methyltransferase